MIIGNNGQSNLALGFAHPPYLCSSTVLDWHSGSSAFAARRALIACYHHSPHWPADWLRWRMNQWIPGPSWSSFNTPPPDTFGGLLSVKRVATISYIRSVMMTMCSPLISTINNSNTSVCGGVWGGVALFRQPRVARKEGRDQFNGIYSISSHSGSMLIA